MTLSNAERQRRHRERLSRAAKDGVTPAMIVEAARLEWERIRAESPGVYPSWEERIAEARKSPRKRLWDDLPPAFTKADEEDGWLDTEFGENADLMRKVSAVVRAVRYPPEA